MASTTPAGIAPSTLTSIKSWWDFQHGLHGFPGYQAAVRSGGEVVLSAAEGLADVEAGTPMTTAHLFRIASHSKVFTATAVMQLVERGVWRLDDPIAKWVPELEGGPVAGVTLRELLGHQGGIIRDGLDSDFWQLIGQFPERAELLATGDALKIYPANDFYKYSNYAYSLVGMAFEAAVGKGYNEYVADEIVAPLGLTSTGADWDESRAGEYAAGHTRLMHHGDTRHVIDHVDTHAMAAATGVFSTAEELTRFGMIHYRGSEELLTEESRRLMQRTESVFEVPGGGTRRYGLGMDLTEVGGRRLVGHSGGYPGHITRTAIDPQAQFVVSFLGNSLDSPSTALAEGAIGLINLAESLAKDESPEVSEEVAARFTGRFTNLWGTIDVVHLGGRLVALDPGAADAVGGWLAVDVIDDDHMRFRPADGGVAHGESIEYLRDAAGNVTSTRGGGGSRWPVEGFVENVRPGLLGSRTGDGADAR